MGPGRSPHHETGGSEGCAVRPSTRRAGRRAAAPPRRRMRNRMVRTGRWQEGTARSILGRDGSLGSRSISWPAGLVLRRRGRKNPDSLEDLPHLLFYLLRGETREVPARHEEEVDPSLPLQIALDPTKRLTEQALDAVSSYRFADPLPRHEGCAHIRGAALLPKPVVDAEIASPRDLSIPEEFLEVLLLPETLRFAQPLAHRSSFRYELP